jgi:hypothetical protein
MSGGEAPLILGESSHKCGTLSEQRMFPRESVVMRCNGLLSARFQSQNLPKILRLT